MRNIVQDDINALYQKIKQYRVKLYLLNSNYQIIDELQGEMISGSMSIDSSSDIRRSCNFVFFVKDRTYFTNETSKIWMDKFVDIKIGVDYHRTGGTLWYDMGLFLFNENSFQYDSVTRNITVNCLDMMSKFTGSRGGALHGLSTTIPAGNNMRSVIVDTVTQLGGISRLIVNGDPDYPTIPYDLEFSTGVSVYGILDKIRNLTVANEMFFDTSGTFVFQKIPTGTNDPVVLNNDILGELIISESIKNSFSDVKNAIEVWGEDNSTDTMYEINAIVKLVNEKPSVIGDSTYYVINPDSPFTVEKIGEIWCVLSGGEYSQIYNEDLLRQRGEYEIYLDAALNDTVSLYLILIPWLDVNQKISYINKITGITNEYLIKSISSDFTSGIMTMELIKFNPLYSWL